mmetsp:Transcript_41807/g.134828  ORF Transcript_41807/g.134828 Transcript_41807/m.134828 type:complete len:236 (-) Transcript_41807:2328-3035(-)
MASACSRCACSSGSSGGTSGGASGGAAAAAHSARSSASSASYLTAAASCGSGAASPAAAGSFGGLHLHFGDSLTSCEILSARSAASIRCGAVSSSLSLDADLGGSSFLAAGGTNSVTGQPPGRLPAPTPSEDSLAKVAEPRSVSPGSAMAGAAGDATCSATRVCGSRRRRRGGFGPAAGSSRAEARLQWKERATGAICRSTTIGMSLSFSRCAGESCRSWSRTSYSPALSFVLST